DCSIKGWMGMLEQLPIFAQSAVPVFASATVLQTGEPSPCLLTENLYHLPNFNTKFITIVLNCY
ncbi:MAG: hypothetical protein QM295_09395, partial [Bacillota bacterium]|nr:hypothetical protein [Bacillota bacterium]